jgi:hypothetical protein
MRATFRKVDGYRTCLLIRRGPLREDPPPEDRLDRESDVTVVVTPPPQDLRRPRRQASVARMWRSQD